MRQHSLKSLAVALALLGALPALADDAGGTVSGTLNATPAKFRAGSVVYLANVTGTFRPGKPVTVDQKGMKFSPRVVAVVKGTTVRFQNSDSVRHNVFSPDGEKYDLGT